jgi:NitT/TauT family transport system substrate-binding protein
MQRVPAVLLVVLVTLSFAAPAMSQGRSEVPVTLGFSVDGRAAWLYVGMYRGYFSQEGLSVRVLRGFGTEAAAQTVDQNRFLFGVNIDLTSVMVLRQRGSDVKGVMVINARSPHGLQAFADKNLRTPKDLEGMSIGLQPGTAGARMLPIFLRVNNVDPTKVRIVPLSSDVYVSAFLSGRIDVINGFYDALYQTVRLQGEKRGRPLAALWNKDWGLDTYGTLLIAKEATLRDRPDLVRRFMRAAKRSIDAAKADPEKAITMMRVSVPEVDAELALAQWKALLEIGEDGKTPRGCADLRRMQQSVDTYREAFEITEPMTAGSVFTNDFMSWCK